MAALHPQLEQDCLRIGQLKLCHLLLMNDASYPWFVLVPDREQIREVHQLCREERWQLMEESALLAHCMEQLFNPDKLNVAALGNQVPQLHIHHIARFTDDAAWPKPVWGLQPARPYAVEASNGIRRRMVECLGENLLKDHS